jgi:glycosyltransferase involved in cell wall biosynthesis
MLTVAANVQRKGVAGIGRAMSSFAEYLHASNEPIQLIELAVASAADGAADPMFRWQRYANGGGSGWELRTPKRLWVDAAADAKDLAQLRERLAPLTAAYRERLETDRPDIVLVSGTYYRPWCLLQAARGLGIPVVLHYHGSVVQEMVGTSGRLELAMAMERDFGSTSRTIFPSRLALQQARSSFLTARGEETAVVIPNSVSSIFFDATGAHDPSQLGFVARWEPVKNTDFILAFADFNERSSRPYGMTAVTDLAPEDAAEFALPHLHFREPLGTDALAAFYASIGAMLCPSRFETFGYVPAEAVAAGTPALVAKTIGASEVFESAGLGRLVVEFASPEAVAQLLPGIIAAGISDAERQALRALVGPGVAEAALCAVLRSVGRT